MPSARADVLDEVIDQALLPFLDAGTSGVDWDALLTPSAWGEFFSPAHWSGVFTDLNALTAGASSAASAASTPDAVASFNQDVYTPLHGAIEHWITSDLGQKVDGVINQLAGSDVIGNGTPGTAAHPDGSSGAWLFGDGGAGWSSTFAVFPGVTAGLPGSSATVAPVVMAGPVVSVPPAAPVAPVNR